MQIVAWAFAMLLAVASSVTGVVRAAEADDEAERWTAASYARIINVVFVTPTDSVVASNPNIAWLLTVRVQGADPRDRECQLTIASTYDHHVRATIPQPVGGSVREQIAQVHHHDITISVEEATKRVRMEDKVLTDIQYARLTALASQLANLCLGHIPQNEMTVDATRYQVWGDAGSQRAYFSVLGPHNASKGQTELVKWITRTRAVLEARAK
jgi:hypothetical protein